MVLMPNTAKGGGISRKIFSSSDRNKIRGILNEIKIPKPWVLLFEQQVQIKQKMKLKKTLKIH